MIKALFFDIDGTLLTSSKRISEKTRGALKICRENGVKVFTATGRPPLLLKMLDFDVVEREIIQDGGVFYNGGCIRLKDNNIYTFLSDDVANKCIKAAAAFQGANLVIQMENEIHSFRYDLKEDEYKYWGVNKEDLKSFENTQFCNVVKIVMLVPNHCSQDLCDSLRTAIGSETNLYTYGAGEYSLVEVIDKNTNKKLAIERIAGIYGWENDEIAVFGDDYNDVDMLKGFKYSFAMGNACDEVKSYANNITLGNDEEGIYHALSEVLRII